jgi:hypothetical protein
MALRNLNGLVVVVALAAAGCGARVAPSNEPASTPDCSSDAQDADAYEPPCPASPPTIGRPCSAEGVECMYGNSANVDCRPTFVCKSGAWKDEPLQGAGACLACGGSASCPASAAGTDGVDCSGSAICAVTGGGTCWCGPGSIWPLGCGPRTWRCSAPAPGCDVVPANPGTTCSSEGLLCRYNNCGPKNARECIGGIWTFASAGYCPVSTRRAKTDIEYLGPDELARVARDVQSMKLATWSYNVPGLDDGRRHLGIIIEDQPPASFAVDPKRSMVDLYGYTSMLVATVQAQGKAIAAHQIEIDMLTHEIADLRREMTRRSK